MRASFTSPRLSGYYVGVQAQFSGQVLQKTQRLRGEATKEAQASCSKPVSKGFTARVS